MSLTDLHQEHGMGKVAHSNESLPRAFSLHAHTGKTSLYKPQRCMLLVSGIAQVRDDTRACARKAYPERTCPRAFTPPLSRRSFRASLRPLSASPIARELLAAPFASCGRPFVGSSLETRLASLGLVLGCAPFSDADLHVSEYVGCPC